MRIASIKACRLLAEVIVFVAALAAIGVAQAAAAVRELAAEGAGDRLWVAEVTSGDASAPGGQVIGDRTRLYSWVAMSTEGWRRATTVGAAVRDLGHRGTQLVALLKTGEWMFIWPEGRSTGPALPAEGEMVAVGGDGKEVWAIGSIAGGMASIPPPTTAPTTDRAAAAANGPSTATRPAAAPAVTTAPSDAPKRLVLLRLQKSSWIAEGELPEEIPVGTRSLSMEVVRGRVVVAVVIDGEVRVYERAADGAWASTGPLKPDNVQVVRAKVLDGGDRPILWVAGATGAGVLYFTSGQQQSAQQQRWEAPVQMRVVGADLSQPLPRDVAVVQQRLRLIFAKGDKLYHQPFDWRDGQPRGQLTPIVPSSGHADGRSGFWINAAVMAVLLMVMIGAMRRRGEIEEAVRRIEHVPLAPLGLRLAAALVDLWPHWAAMAYLVSCYGVPENVDAQIANPVYAQVWSIAMGVYIAHTMLLEILTGASIGKLLFGLRVVRLNGERPTTGAFFVRNLMRAVDFGLLFVGAVMILMSPLRQRTGDLAAGTIVVRRTVRPDEVLTPENEAANSATPEQ